MNKSDTIGKPSDDAVTEAIVVRPQADMALSREPEVVLGEAHRAAAALKKVIDAKAKKVTFNGEVYLEYEDWQTVAKFYGVTARVREVKYVEFGDVKGFEAFAEAVLVSRDQVISAADAMCLNDEENWSTRTKYEYHYFLKRGGTAKEADPSEMVWEPNPKKPGKSRPKREKVAVGDAAVPLFQLRSMAQTRACAKALRNALAWVVVLAGYKPTPAEEMQQSGQPQEILLADGELVDMNTKEASDAVARQKIADGNARIQAEAEARKQSDNQTVDSGSEALLQGRLDSVSQVKYTKDKNTPYIIITVENESGAKDVSVWDKKLFDGKTADEWPISDYVGKDVRCIVKLKGKYANLVAIESVTQIKYPEPEVERRDELNDDPSYGEARGGGEDDSLPF